MSEDSPSRYWSKLVNEAFRGNGSSLDTALLYEQQLADAGFVNIRVVRDKWPVNRWPKDKRYKQLGKSVRCLSCPISAPYSRIVLS